MKKILILLLMIAGQLNGQQLSTSSLYNDAIEAHEQGNIAEAVYNLELASIISPMNTDVKHNLEIVKRDIPVDIIELEDFFLKRWTIGFANVLSPFSWKVLFFVLILIVLGLLYLKWIKKANSWYTNTFLIVFLLLFVVNCIVFGSVRENVLHGGNYAIIMDGKLEQLKQGPDNVSPDVKAVSAGVKVKILDSSGEWYEVATMDKEYGWLPQHTVKILRVDE